MLQVPDLYDPRTQWASYIINAIKAKELFIKDINYIIKNKEVRVKAGASQLSTRFTGFAVSGACKCGGCIPLNHRGPADLGVKHQWGVVPAAV